MSATEVRAEITADLIDVNSRTRIYEKEFRRVVLKTSRFPVYFKPVAFTTKRKNRWLALYEAKNKKNANDIPVVYVCILDSKSGLNAFMLSVKNGGFAIVMYPSHFFQRYRERFLEGNTSLKSLDVITSFFRYNPAFTFDKQGEIMNGSCLHGVCLGEELEENFIIFKTFVTYDMLKGDQVLTYEQLFNLLSETEKEVWSSQL